MRRGITIHSARDCGRSLVQSSAHRVSHEVRPGYFHPDRSQKPPRVATAHRSTAWPSSWGKMFSLDLPQPHFFQLVPIVSSLAPSSPRPPGPGRLLWDLGAAPPEAVPAPSASPYRVRGPAPPSWWPLLNLLQCFHGFFALGLKTGHSSAHGV